MKCVLILVLSTFVLKISAQQLNPINVGESFNIQSAVLKENRTVLIYLPEGYKESVAAYPVVYLMDAETHWLHTGSTTGFLSLLGEIPKAIVVGVINTDRARDMTPHPAVPDKDFPGGGGSALFLSFLKDELKPYIQSHYRTQPFSVLAGTSLSGLFVVNAFITHPLLFNAYFAASPSMWWDKGAVVGRVQKALQQPIYHNRFLFISLCKGDSKELQDKTQAVLELLKHRTPDSLHSQYFFISDENHNSSPLKSFYAGFKWLYQGWPPGEGITTLAAMTKHYLALSQQYDYAIPIPETDINNLGYSLLFSEKKLEAISIFKLNTEKYPRSANAWDSLGDAYKLNGQLNSAQAAYGKGCEIATQTHNINAASMCGNLEKINQQIAEKAKK